MSAAQQTVVYEPSHTTHWKSLHPRKNLLLGAHNLNAGEELIAEITHAARQMIINQNGKEEEVAVVHFTNCAPMVLNMTNSKSIAFLYGEDIDKWIGCAVQIYATNVQAFGKETAALRIRTLDPSPISDKELINLKAILEKTGSDINKFCAAFHCKSIDGLAAVNYPRAMRMIKKKLAK